MATALSSDIIPEIEDLLACCMCLETLDEPKSLPCSHTFCKVCLAKYVEGLRDGKNIEVFPCPTCRSDFTLKSNQDVGELPCIYFIKNMLQLMAIERQLTKGSRCSSCEGTAIKRCMTCEMFMCEKCDTYHGLWPVMKNHDVFSLEELSNPECQMKMRRKLYCQKHADKILEYYCESCKELSCIHCMVLNHTKQNHSCVSVDEIGQQQREKLQASCATLDEKLSKVKEALTAIDEVMKSLENNAQTAKNQIHEQKEKMINKFVEKVEEQTKKMVDVVDKIYDGFYGELSKQHQVIKDYVDKVQRYVVLPRNLLKRGCVEEILSSQKGIEENIEKLKNEQPENLIAVNDGHIQFVPDDVDDIDYDAILDKFGSIPSLRDKREPEVLRELRPRRVKRPQRRRYYRRARRESTDLEKSNELRVPGDLKSSRIFTEEIAIIEQLPRWLGDKCGWNLCYRASRDGWGAEDFHRHCDYQGPTVVLVKANNCIFGGYTDNFWGGTHGYTFSKASFLFSLRNKDNVAPFIANIKQGEENNAIYCYGLSGPWFGCGDILIQDKPQLKNVSFCNFGQSYQLPPGYFEGTDEARNLLAGEYYFSPSEIEVYY